MIIFLVLSFFIGLIPGDDYLEDYYLEQNYSEKELEYADIYCNNFCYEQNEASYYLFDYDIYLEDLVCYCTNENDEVISYSITKWDNFSNDNNTQKLKQTMPITYSFNVIKNHGGTEIVCLSDRKQAVRLAFSRIENETGGVVNFKEVDGESNIKIMCGGHKTEDLDKSWYYDILGEATMGTLGEKVNGSIIFYFNKQIYYNDDGICWSVEEKYHSCIYDKNDTSHVMPPQVFDSSTELHEIFHVFGFGHNENSVIMNPIKTSKYNSEIDDYIIEDLIYYYG